MKFGNKGYPLMERGTILVYGYGTGKYLMLLLSEGPAYMHEENGMIHILWKQTINEPLH